MQRRGRPRIPLADAVFSACMKVYGGPSRRRTMIDMREYEPQGLIDGAPHYNRTFECLENSGVTTILKAMIEESARPLREVETDFAVDSTGFSSSVYRRWFDAKYGRERPNLWRQAFAFFQDHKGEFYRPYHRRSNVEITFSMIKAKFGTSVRSKSADA